LYEHAGGPLLKALMFTAGLILLPLGAYILLTAPADGYGGERDRRPARLAPRAAGRLPSPDRLIAA
jgi:hypothetical protein